MDSSDQSIPGVSDAAAEHTIANNAESSIVDDPDSTIDDDSVIQELSAELEYNGPFLPKIIYISEDEDEDDVPDLTALEYLLGYGKLPAIIKFFLGNRAELHHKIPISLMTAKIVRQLKFATKITDSSDLNQFSTGRVASQVRSLFVFVTGKRAVSDDNACNGKVYPFCVSPDPALVYEKPEQGQYTGSLTSPWACANHQYDTEGSRCPPQKEVNGQESKERTRIGEVKKKIAAVKKQIAAEKKAKVEATKAEKEKAKTKDRGKAAPKTTANPKTDTVASDGEQDADIVGESSAASDSKRKMGSSGTPSRASAKKARNTVLGSGDGAGDEESDLFEGSDDDAEGESSLYPPINE